jgi:hypothetical protein
MLSAEDMNDPRNLAIYGQLYLFKNDLSLPEKTYPEPSKTQQFTLHGIACLLGLIYEYTHRTKTVTITRPAPAPHPVNFDDYINPSALAREERSDERSASLDEQNLQGAHVHDAILIPHQSDSSNSPRDFQDTGFDHFFDRCVASRRMNCIMLTKVGTKEVHPKATVAAVLEHNK